MPAVPGRQLPTPAPRQARRVLAIDADSACIALLDQWLTDAGFEVVHDADAGATLDLVIVDLPQPRSGGPQPAARVAVDHPGTPILAISSAFFAGIEHCTTAPRMLGVAAVLAKPMSREALLAQVRRLLE